ncbi:MAG: hypothetical protein K1X79_07230 [Oligoflexia bacterium]|nr:hypothetical protein [Oligoflexia bacterium]
MEISERLNTKLFTPWTLMALALACASFVLFQCAWVADDLYITIRTIDNFVNGYGLSWSIYDRILAITHPLWLLLLTPFYALTRESYYTPIAISIVLSLLTIAILGFHFLATQSRLFLLIFLLLGSKCFIDYSTSGFENCLAHFLLAVFLTTYFSKRRSNSPHHFLSLTFLGALIILNRLDHIILVAPALAESFFRQKSKRRACLEIILGFLPFAIWEAFSLVYYGFALPNTYYAKLVTGYDLDSHLFTGTLYFVTWATWDLLSLLTVAIGTSLQLFSRKRRHQALAVATILYITYVVWIGGDYMMGRFLSAPFLVSLFGLLKCIRKNSFGVAFLICLSSIYLLANSRSNIRTLFEYPSDISPAPISITNVIDGRGRYSPGYALPVNFPTRFAHVSNAEYACNREDPIVKAVRVEAIMGIVGWGSCREQKIIDVFAITDPLLAHIPALPNQRVGHYLRAIPVGYLESVAADKNLITDPNLNEFNEKLLLLMKGELWSLQRFVEIAKMNLGYYDTLITKYAERQYDRIPATMLALKSNEGARVEHGITQFTSKGLSVQFGGQQSAKQLEMTIQRENGRKYRIIYKLSGKVVTSSEINEEGREFLKRLYLAVPSQAQRGFDSIHIEPTGGDGTYYIQNLILH